MTQQAADSPVLLTVVEGVATIELNRPAQFNALDMALANALADAVGAVAADDAAHVLLLRGGGRMFCAGGDLTAMNGAPKRGAFVRELADAAHRAILALEALRKPVVAAVQGSAAGAGLSLVLASDLVLIGASARLTTAYAAVGLTPDCGMSWLLPRAVGTKRALELTLTPRVLKAGEAVAWGIATEVIDDAELHSAAERLAKRLADGPYEALGLTRHLVRSSPSRSLSEHLDLESASIAAMGAGEDAGGRISTFLSRSAR